MTGFHRKIFPSRLKKTKDELRRELEVEKAAFAASGGKPRSFYERRACPDAYRPPDSKSHFGRWQPKYRKNAKQKRAARNARKRARKKERMLKSPDYVLPTSELQKSPPDVLKRYSAKLNGNLPASEKWFLALYKEHKLLRNSDRFNEPFADVCIPDIVNHELRYIIEVQDPTHKKVERIVKDARKNVLFAKSGYRAFYVWAWDHLSFDAFLPVFKEFLRYKLYGYDPLRELESF
jgi:hypothetical protein